MKVLIVSGAAPFSTRDVWDGYVNSLRQYGATVVPYPLFSVLSYLSVDAACNDIIGKALDLRNDFDAAVFIDGLFFRNGREHVPLTLSSHGLQTAVIATDDPYERIADEAYSIRFTNERKMATPEIGYLPVATEIEDSDVPEYVIHNSIEQDIDIVFVGTIFADRWPLMRDLARYCELNRIRFEIEGHFVVDFQELLHLRYVRISPNTVLPEARRNLYRRSKLVLNLFRSSEEAESLNPRAYEVAAMGVSALVTSYRPEVSDIFGDSFYTFSSFKELIAQIHRALDHPLERQHKIAAAMEVARSAHLYRHRVPELLDTLMVRQGEAIARATEEFPVEPRVCWVFGAGRTGSTWLLEMLQSIPGVKGWNEPCFGWLFTSLSQHPGQLERSDAFFSRGSLELWTEGLKQTFLAVAKSRWRDVPVSEILVVKDVNSPEFAPFFSSVFPNSKFLLLVRDPYDVLDSHVDMQRAGSWNDTFWQDEQRHWSEQRKIEFLARHIERSFRLSLQGFKNCSRHNRFQMSYEELLSSPEESLRRCVEFIGSGMSVAEVQGAVDANHFERFEGKKGRAHFRRYGRPEVWKTSSNFTVDVLQIANTVLGPLREELGYVLARPESTIATPGG